MNDPLAPLEEIMRRHGVQSTTSEFHAAVNVCFHRFESDVYDELHGDMWESLPPQVELLASACVRAGAPEKIRMLDIGCGTGLATDSLMRSSLGPRVVEIDLLDTSTAMLARAQKRREQWNRPGQAIEGIVESVPAGKSYDLIITSSVLHHVPDLASFLKGVAALQMDAPGALFIHLQDPNGDCPNDPQKAARMAEFAPKVPDTLARFKPSRILGRLKRELTGEQGQDYISKTNRELIAKGVITNPLSVDELFSITDIHVRDGGIYIEKMKTWLPDYELVRRQSYGFFGVLASHLPPALRIREEQYIRDGELNGEHNAAAWQRRG
jgi:SAM-dependent methyltransferase